MSINSTRSIVVACVTAVAVVIAGAWFLSPATQSTAAAASPARVMPLGDSITGSPGCWRALLSNRLVSSGYANADFVGTLNNNGSCPTSFDGDNEGHGGYLATNIANNRQLPGWLASAKPDVVMMHLGTNDVWNNISTATILAAYATLVDQMRASNPNMRIIVAKILPMNPSGCSACGQRVVTLNAAIPGWASGKSTSASPITVVDQWTGFNTASDTVDGVHPNSSGNKKIADRWYPALTAVLDGRSIGTPSPNPSPTPTATTGGSAAGTLVGIASGRCVDAAGGVAANGTQLIIADCSAAARQKVTFAGATIKVQGYCLDAYAGGTSSGTRVILWTCHGGGNQAWNRNSNGTITGVGSGLCLDVKGAATAAGSTLQLWTCNGGGNQKWTLR